MGTHINNCAYISPKPKSANKPLEGISVAVPYTRKCTIIQHFKAQMFYNSY